MFESTKVKLDKDLVAKVKRYGDIAGYSGSVDVKQPVWLLQEVQRIDSVLEDLIKRHGDEVRHEY